MSGLVDPALGDQLRQLGADVFLPKPVDSGVLNRALGGILPAA